MRIVIDMQGAQTQSRHRGIGRYTIDLVKGLVRNGNEHEFMLVMNGMIPNSIDVIRNTFQGHLPESHFKIWYAPTPLAFEHPNSEFNRSATSFIYQTFINRLQPDIVLVTSMMEGWSDDYFCSLDLINTSTPCASIVYDFIPYRKPEKFLPNDLIRTWYAEQLEKLKKITLGLAISNHSAYEAVDILPEVDVVPISTACSDCFAQRSYESSFKDDVLKKFNITKPFILYVGGLDPRKNVTGLFESFRKLPDLLHKTFQLALPCGGQSFMIDSMRTKALEHGLKEESLCLLGAISDEDLCLLYNTCSLFVFPSFEEGFGLPVLEAMRCGAPVIASNATSIPEIVGMDEALFDPYDTDAMAKKIEQALTDCAFRERLIANGNQREKLFSWDITAQKALSAMEQCVATRNALPLSGTTNERLDLMCSQIAQLGLTEQQQLVIADVLAKTFTEDSRPQLLVDIGTLAGKTNLSTSQSDGYKILAHLLRNQPNGYVVSPVYICSKNNCYRYAHELALRAFEYDDGMPYDCPIDWSADDLFLGLDLQLDAMTSQACPLMVLHRHGISIHFVVSPQFVNQLSQTLSTSPCENLNQWFVGIDIDISILLCKGIPK